MILQPSGRKASLLHILVRTVLAGIRRAKGTAQTGKRPILTEDLRQLVACLPNSLAGRRDRALLLLGFAGGFRRSELVSLSLHDLTFTGDGLIVIWSLTAQGRSSDRSIAMGIFFPAV